VVRISDNYCPNQLIYGTLVPLIILARKSWKEASHMNNNDKEMVAHAKAVSFYQRQRAQKWDISDVCSKVGDDAYDADLRTGACTPR
jgi:hypothetical protein